MVLNRLYFVEIMPLQFSKCRIDDAPFSVKEKGLNLHFEDLDYNHDESISLSEFNKIHLIYADMQ